MDSWSLFAAVAFAALSGVPAAVSSRSAGPRLSAGMLLLAAALGVLAAIDVLATGGPGSAHIALSPLLPALILGLDALSAVFLLPVCFVCACVAVYELGYWPPAPKRGRTVPMFLGLLTAALMTVLAAQDAMSFLIAWEVMALSAFFLVATEHHRFEVRVASWIYLGATHAGTLVLVAFFCCWSAASGSLALVPLATATAPAWRDALFLLALAGFGLKAGVVPLHFWLPVVHANAPSHVSSVMSGVLIKMGVYGVVRAAWLLPDQPLWWGAAVLGIGAVSAVVGVAFAIGQHDLKRLLAYHSIENIGIIFLGLGLALLGRTTGNTTMVALGLGGALLHVWNHGLFKCLLFLAAGASIRACGTREIDRLGGLAHRMPQTAGCFLIGAIAICGLPPLNGFVSELLTYLGLFRALGEASAAAAATVAIPALALAGAMALLCFVKVFGVVYLGLPRGAAAAAAQEAPRVLRAPMFALGAACLGIGLVPAAALPALQPAIAVWMAAGTRPAELGALVPCAWISGLGFALLAAAASLWVWLGRRRAIGQPPVGTWDCGYARPTPSMQYTASSFAQQFVDCSSFLLMPRTRRPAIAGLFPAAGHFHSYVVDLVLDRVLLPVLRRVAAVCNWLRGLQRGRVQLYLLYVFLTLLCLLLFA
jgi:hydrogenase-4 component B